MPSTSFTVEVKPPEKSSREYFMELVRLKGGFLFDEVGIKKINFHVSGVEVQYDYERHGNRMTGLESLIVSKQDWAASRQAADAGGTPAEKRARFASTPLAARLFADGSRQFNNQVQHAEEDFVADAGFLDALTPSQE